MRRGRQAEHASGGGEQHDGGRSDAVAQKLQSPRCDGERPVRGGDPTETARQPDSPARPPIRSSCSSSAPARVERHARDAHAPSPITAWSQRVVKSGAAQARPRGSNACGGGRPRERAGSASVDGPPAAEAREPAQKQKRRAERRAVARWVARGPPAAGVGAATADRCSRSGRRSGERRGGRRVRSLRARRSARSCPRPRPLRLQSPLRPRSNLGERG